MIKLLPDSIFVQAARYPERPAFRYMGKALTYGELATKVNQVANALFESGVRKGDRVGVVLNRCLETAIAIYGIMRCGAVYVPFNPKAPASRNQFLVRNCDIQVLLSNNMQKRTLKGILDIEKSITTIIGVEGEWPVDTVSWSDVFKFDTNFQEKADIDENDLAYIIFTSGSTGEPKGIMHTHASGLAYARLTASTYEITASDILANHAPIFFDISTLGYFTAPYVGASTVILSDAHTILPSSLAKVFGDEKITIWYSVPLALVQLVEKGLLQDCDTKTLRWLFYAGEAFPPMALRTLMQNWAHVKVSNIYGPTETNQCTNYDLTEIPGGDSPIPIGRVWAETEDLILDENEKPVRDNQPGILYIHSSTLMKGYWRNEALSKASFFYDQNGKAYYRTGDLVRKDEQGILHFIGRKDHQVKIRGYRIELGAIELALLNHEQVSAAIVYVETEEEQKLIRAAVVAKENIPELELMTFLKTKLPPYAIPESIYFLEKFPQTGSGKIDRKQIMSMLSNGQIVSR